MEWLYRYYRRWEHNREVVFPNLIFLKIAHQARDLSLVVMHNAKSCMHTQAGNEDSKTDNLDATISNATSMPFAPVDKNMFGQESTWPTMPPMTSLGACTMSSPLKHPKILATGLRWA